MVFGPRKIGRDSRVPGMVGAEAAEIVKKKKRRRRFQYGAGTGALARLSKFGPVDPKRDADPEIMRHSRFDGTW